MDTFEPILQNELERAFRVSEQTFGGDEEYRELFSSIVERLRMESAGLPMTTVQELLLERIAFNYVMMKYKEDSNTYTRPNESKELQSFWLGMTAEFNKVMNAGHDKLRDKLLQDVERLVMDAIKAVKSPEDRKAIQQVLYEGFAKMGL